jgi:hypothetical protein
MLRVPTDINNLVNRLSAGRASPLIKGRQRGSFALSIVGLNEVQSALPLETHTTNSHQPYALKAIEYLKKPLSKVTDPTRRAFLAEAIACLGVDAKRATIVLTWIAAVDHLYEYILVHKLADFNAALRRRNGPEARLTISTRDDFNDLKESIFIEVCRSSGIVTNDVRKILDEKLGFRNSCAHPSTISIGEAKVVTFIEDLIDNVMTKYPI